MSRKIRIHYVVLTLIWIGVITYFSSQTSAQSSSQSMWITSVLASILKFDQIEFLHFIIRKCAHAFEYFVLGFLVYHCSFSQNKKWFVCSVIICIIVASCDEFHQLFVYLRSGSVKDVCLDSISSLISILICHKFLKF